MYRSLLLLPLTILILLSSASGQTSQKGRISGKLTEEKSSVPIPFATVSLRRAADSVLISGKLTDSLGRFVFSDVDHGNYIIGISLLSYAKKQFNVSIGLTTLTADLGNIPLSADATQLSTVQVIARLPLFQNRSDGTTEVNVAGSVLSASSSVSEILGRTPGVTVSEEGISVLGKGEAILYLNGRRATAQQLASLPVNQISKIEVVANPSAKYDAEGNAIINVITFSSAGQGYNVNLRGQWSLSDFTTPVSAYNTDASYKKGNFEFRTGYGLSLGTNREILNTTRTRTGDNFRSELMTDWKRKQLNFSNYTVGVQYALNSKSYLSAEYIGSSNHLGGNTDNTNQISSTTLQGSFSSKIDPDVNTNNHSVSANYHLNLDTLGSGLLLGAQLASYRSVNDDMIYEYNQTPSGSSGKLVHNDAFQDIDLSVLQADLTRVLSSSHKIELGAKFGMASTGSGTDFYRTSAGLGFPLIPEVSNRFTYEENIAAAYGNLLGSIGKKLSYGVGLRIERTGYQLATGSASDPVTHNSYTDLFPNAYLSFRASQNTQLRASYSNRIARPRYQALNPSVIYQDAFTSIEGNPLLRPENIHAIELGANYRSYALKIGYNYVIDPISAAALQSGQPNGYVLKSLNFSTLNSWFISFNAPVNIAFWNSVNTVSMTQSTYRADNLDFVMNKSTPQLYLYSSNTFRAGNLFKLQLLGWYQSKRNLGTSFNKDRALLALGLEKEFLKGTLKLNLLANDLLATDRPRGTYDVGGTFVEYARKNNTRYYRATLSYSFGGLKKSTFKNTSVGQTESGRAL